MIAASKRHLTSKRFVLVLMVLLFSAILLSLAIPQRFSAPAEEFAQWQNDHQAWLPMVEFLGLHRLFTAPLFVVLLALFLLSLAITTQEQFIRARMRTFGLGADGAAGLEPVDLDLSAQEIKKRITGEGYLKVAEKEGVARYVKHPWGHWGLFFLHLGMLIAVASSLLVASTEKRGALRMIEGEIHTPASPWIYEERGLFAGPFILPEALHLRRVTPEFWPQGNIKNIRSEAHFISPEGRTSRQTIAITPILTYRGVRFQHENRFGNAFYLLFTDQDGTEVGVIVDIDNPQEKEKASYGNFDFVEIPFHIKAKYFADVDKKTLISDNPLLVLRLLSAKQEIVGELALQRGGRGALGPYQVELVQVKRWASFVALDSQGIPGVFLGFFIIVLGVALNYFTIPREFRCEKREEGFRLTWKGRRYQQLYQQEYEIIMERLKGLVKK